MLSKRSRVPNFKIVKKLLTSVIIIIVIVVIGIIIIIMSYHMLPFLWYYFFWTNIAPYHSGFKFQIVAFSLLCATSLVQLFLVETLPKNLLVFFQILLFIIIIKAEIYGSCQCMIFAHPIATMTFKSWTQVLCG